MKNINDKDLHSNLKHWLDKVIDNKSGFVIKRSGNKDLALITLDEYNSLKETIYLLSGNNRDILLNSIKELESRPSKEYKITMDKMIHNHSYGKTNYTSWEVVKKEIN